MSYSFDRLHYDINESGGDTLVNSSSQLIWFFLLASLYFKFLFFPLVHSLLRLFFLTSTHSFILFLLYYFSFSCPSHLICCTSFFASVLLSLHFSTPSSLFVVNFLCFLLSSVTHNVLPRTHSNEQHKQFLWCLLMYTCWHYLCIKSPLFFTLNIIQPPCNRGSVLTPDLWLPRQWCAPFEPIGHACPEPGINNSWAARVASVHNRSPERERVTLYYCL